MIHASRASASDPLVQALPPPLLLADPDVLAVRRHPFHHVLSNRAIPQEHYAELAGSFPGIEHFTAQPATLDNRVIRLSSQQILEDEHFAPGWQRFVEGHASQAFWSLVVRHFGDEMRRRYPGLEDRLGKRFDDFQAIRRGTSAQGDVILECQLVANTPVLARASSVRSAHVDDVGKVWSGLLYLRDDDDDSKGGDLHLYGTSSSRRYYGCQTSRTNRDPGAKVEYRANQFVGFVNSPIAVHSVSPRLPTPRVRRYVNLIAEFGFPLFELPQMSWLQRKWFRAFGGGHRSR